MKPHDNSQDASLICDAVESMNTYNNSSKLNYKPLILLQAGSQSTLSPFVGSLTIEQYSAEDNESCSSESDYTNTVSEEEKPGSGAQETLPSQDVANLSSKRNELKKKGTSFVITNEESCRDVFKCSNLTQNVTNNQEHAASPVKLSSSFKRSKSPSKNNVPETKTARYCLCKSSKSELKNINFEDLMNMATLGEKLFSASKNLVKTCSKENISNERKSPKNLDPCCPNLVSKNYESRKKASENLPKPNSPNGISKISENQKILHQKVNKPYVVCYRYETDPKHLSSESDSSTYTSKLDPLKHPEEINATTSADFSEVSAATITVQTQRRLSYDVSDQDRCCSVDCSKRKVFKENERVQTCCDSAICTLLRPSEYGQQSTNTSNRSSKDPSTTNQASSRTTQFEERSTASFLLDNDSVSVDQQPLRQGGDKSMSKKTKYLNKLLKSPFTDSNKKNKRNCDCCPGECVDCSAIDQLQQKVKHLEISLKDLLENGNLPQLESSLAMSDSDSINCTCKNNNRGSYNENLADDKNFISSFPTSKNNNVKTTKTTSQTVMTSKTILSLNVQNNKETTMYTDQNIQTLKTQSTEPETIRFQPKQKEIKYVDRKQNNPSGCCGHTIILPPNYFEEISKPVKKKSKNLKPHRHRTELKDLKALTKKCIKMLQNRYCKGRVNNDPLGDHKRENYDTFNRMRCENCASENRKQNCESYNMCNRGNFEKRNGDYRENPDNHGMNNKRFYENSDRDYRRSFENHDMYNRRNSVLRNEDYRENPDNHEMNNKRLYEHSDRDYRGNFENHDMYNRRNSEKNNKDYRENPHNYSMNTKKLSENLEGRSRGSLGESLEIYLYNTENAEKQCGIKRYNFENHETDNKRNLRDYACYNRNYVNHDRDCRRSLENHDMYNRRNSVLNNEDYRENPDNDSMNYKKLSEILESSSRGSHRGNFENYDMYNRRNSEKNNEDYRENPDNQSMNYKKLSENPYNRSRGGPRESFERYYNTKNSEKQYGDYRNNFEDYETDNKRNLQNHKTCHRRKSENYDRHQRGNFENHDMFNGRDSEKRDCREKPNWDYRESFENRKCNRRNFEKQYGDYKENPDNHDLNNERLYGNPDGDYRENFENCDMYNKKNSENNVENLETDNKRDLRNYKPNYKRNFENNDKIGRRSLEKSNTNLSRNLENDKNDQIDKNIDHQNAVKDQDASEMIDSSTPPSKQYKSSKTHCFLTGKKAAKPLEVSKKAVVTLQKPLSTDDVKLLASDDKNNDHEDDSKEFTEITIRAFSN